ncbi:MAG TPA: DUF2007 domain-containing protein [Candidatus Acidoferrales bacterium]|nr:DUF2007 domain-containing protein [Candidatus Acidoferrales bacterium]
MADGEMEELAKTAGQMTDAARETLRLEIARRGLAFPLQPVAKAQAQPQWRKLVTLRVFRDIPDALIAKSILDSAGIRCFLADENLIRMDWFYSNLLGGVKLWVNDEDAEAAAALLDAGVSATFPAGGRENDVLPHCPKCQSLDIMLEDLETRRLWKCNACGAEWPDDDSDEPAS